MQRRYALILLAVAIGSLAVMLWFALSSTSLAHAAQALPSLASSVFPFVATPTPTAGAQASSNSSDGLDPAVVAAIIAAVAALIAALVAGGFALIQTRYNARLQERLARVQKELDEQYQAKDQEKQREAATIEASRREMLRAQNNEERAKAYRRALHVDPRISRLQILDMTRPLEVTNVYVRVRVHEETRLRYDVDPLLRAAEAHHDPNALLQAARAYIEQRVVTALDPDAAIRKYRQCIIVGDPGAGKTTLLKFLALKAADNALKGLPDLPIHIELSAFASSEHQDLLDFAAQLWDERYAFFKADARLYMEEMLKAGKALLLLDALDETVIGEKPEIAETSYQRVSEVITRIATRYPDAPMVVTARKAGYQQRSPLIGFTELDVVDFRPEDSEQFVTKWFACYHDPQKDANAADLNSRLARNPRIQALAANPLLLSLIVLVYEAQLDLPDRRAELYKRCVEVLLSEWDAKRNLRRRREFKPDHKRQLLAELAWHFHQQGRRYFPENEVLSLIADFLPKVHLQPEQNGSVLAEIANEHGLLKEQARGWQGFLHLTLQEYFVAQYVTDHQQLDTLLARRGNPWWEEVILLYAGYTPDASPLLRRLIGQDDNEKFAEDIFHTNLILAGRCLAARPTIQQVSLWDTIVNQLFETLMTTEYTLIRELTAQDLAAIGDLQVNKNILRSLSDTQFDLSVRRSMALALGQSGDHSIATDLIHLLSDTQLDPSIGTSIAHTLGSLGDRSIIPDLLHLISNAQLDRNIRSSIASALVLLGDHSIATDLIHLLSDTQLDPSIGTSIARALGSLGNRSVVPDLLHLISNTQVDARIRWDIVDALGMLGDQSIATELLHLLSDPQLELNIRARIPDNLDRLGGHAIVADLVRLLSNPQVERRVRARIAWNLAELGDRSIVADLVALLSDPQLELNIRACITWALGMLGDHSVVADLVHFLSDPQLELNIRHRIAWNLAKLGDRSIVADLVALLSDPQLEYGVGSRIASALGVLGDPSIVDELLSLIADTRLDKVVRNSIAETLDCFVFDAKSINALMHLFLESDIADSLYRVLWKASRRIGISIFSTDESSKGPFELIPWV